MKWGFVRWGFVSVGFCPVGFCPYTVLLDHLTDINEQINLSIPRRSNTHAAAQSYNSEKKGLDILKFRTNFACLVTTIATTDKRSLQKPKRQWRSYLFSLPYTNMKIP